MTLDPVEQVDRDLAFAKAAAAREARRMRASGLSPLVVAIGLMNAARRQMDDMPPEEAGT